MLNEQDRSTLVDIERHLIANDPRLQRLLTRPRRRRPPALATTVAVAVVMVSLCSVLDLPIAAIASAALLTITLVVHGIRGRRPATTPVTALIDNRGQQ